MTLQSSMRRSRSRGHPAAAFEQQTRTNRTDGPPLRRQTLQRGYPRLTLTHESLSAQSKYGGIAMTSRFLAGAVCATTLLLGTCANADPGVYPMSNFLAMFSAVPRQVVNYPNKYEPGTVIVNTHERRLYLILGKGQAMRYGIGVGREGFTWAGVSTVTDKREWPDWTPPPARSSAPYARRTRQSARCARHVSGRYDVPHPRIERAAHHRHRGDLGLHPAHQRGRHRSLPSGQDRRDCHRAEVIRDHCRKRQQPGSLPPFCLCRSSSRL